MSVERRYALIGHTHDAPSGGTWGSITGTLSDQTDLWTVLTGKLSLTGGTMTGLLSIANPGTAGLYINNDTDTSINYHFEMRQAEGTQARNIGILFHQANRWYHRLHARPTGFHLVNGASDTTYVDLYAAGVAVGGSAYPYIWAGTSGSVKVSTGNGYLEIGPQNSGYSHFYTDRAAFYFGQQVQFGAGIADYGGKWSLTTSGTLTLTAASAHITLYDSDGPDPNDRGFLEMNGGSLALWTHDSSANVWHNALSSNIVSGDVTINGTSFSKANSYINAGAWIRLTNGVGFYTDASDYFYNYSGAGWQIRGGQAGATANYLLFQESNGTVRHNITWNSTNLHLYNYNNGVTLRLIPNATYGSISIVGSTGGYGGIRLESASYAPNWMWSTSAVNGGVYFEGLGLWSIYYNYAHHGDRASWFIGTSLYQVPYCTWSANGGSSNAKFSRGTAAPSGGTDGDVYFQYT